MTEPIAFDIEQAAQILNCPPSYLRDAVTARKVRHRRLGKERGIRFTLSDLEALLDSCVVEPESQLSKDEVAEKRQRRKAA